MPSSLPLYAFRPDTGEYTGVVQADPSPMEDGQFLWPAHTTNVEPPKTASGAVAVWFGDSWEVRPDHRGEVWYRGNTPVLVDIVGDPSDIGLTSEPPALPPPPPPSATDVRIEASRRMQALVGARSPAHLDIIISNGTREAVRLLRIGTANWSTEEAARAAALEAVDAGIEAIRSASNALEVMNPVPAGYAADVYWPQQER